MEYIRVTKDNLEREHICCAISNERDVQVASKKAWLADRFEEGLVFLKSTERGKCFIEYIPAENAWNPIDAPGYMYIDCLWVSGAFKGHGYSSELLGACIDDSRAQGKKGLCILSAAKKKPDHCCSHPCRNHSCSYRMPALIEPDAKGIPGRFKDCLPNWRSDCRCNRIL